MSLAPRLRPVSGVLRGEGHGSTARGQIIRQIERVSFREDLAGGIGLGVGVEAMEGGCRQGGGDGGDCI